MLGISNWNPKFYTSFDNLASEQSANFQLVMGKPIVDSWVVWNLDVNRWLSDCPIILDFGNSHLELCAAGIEMYAVTWNKIDVSVPIDYRGISGRRIAAEWRINQHPLLKALTSARITSVEVLEYIYGGTILKDDINPANVGKDFGPYWYLGGLEFRLDNRGLLVTQNGCNTNEILNVSVSNHGCRKKRLV